MVYIHLINRVVWIHYLVQCDPFEQTLVICAIDHLKLAFPFIIFKLVLQIQTRYFLILNKDLATNHDWGIKFAEV